MKKTFLIAFLCLCFSGVRAVFAGSGDLQYLWTREYEKAGTYREEVFELLTRRPELADYRVFRDEERRREQEQRGSSIGFSGPPLSDRSVRRPASRHRAAEEVSLRSCRYRNVPALDFLSKVEFIGVLCEDESPETANERCALSAALWESVYEDIREADENYPDAKRAKDEYVEAKLLAWRKIYGNLKINSYSDDHRRAYEKAAEADKKNLKEISEKYDEVFGALWRVECIRSYSERERVFRDLWRKTLRLARECSGNAAQVLDILKTFSASDAWRRRERAAVPPCSDLLLKRNLALGLTDVSASEDLADADAARERWLMGVRLFGEILAEYQPGLEEKLKAEIDAAPPEAKDAPLARARFAYARQKRIREFLEQTSPMFDLTGRFLAGLETFYGNDIDAQLGICAETGVRGKIDLTRLRRPTLSDEAILQYEERAARKGKKK